MKEVAKKIGVSVSTYRDWEYGRKIPASRILRIAEALAVSVNTLLGEEGGEEFGNIEQAVSLIEEALKKLKKVER